MTLKETLAGALFVSETTGKEREIRLQRGLIISVCVGRKTTRLRLKRNGSRPSRTEWRTVLAAFPYPCEGIGAVIHETDAGEYLEASWPTPPRLLDAGC